MRHFVWGMVLVVAALIGAQLFQASSSVETRSLTIHNVWSQDLTIHLETETGESVELGTVAPGQQREFGAALSIRGEQFKVHAKDPRGFEFFTLYIDRDEVVQRKGQLVIPGRGGRRRQVDRPPAFPAPTVAPMRPSR